MHWRHWRSLIQSQRFFCRISIFNNKNQKKHRNANNIAPKILKIPNIQYRNLLTKLFKSILVPNLQLKQTRPSDHMAKALVVAETFAGKTTAVRVSPSTTPASRRVDSKSKLWPLDDKSPWCHTRTKSSLNGDFLGGWSPFKKNMCKSNWIISPGIGVKIKDTWNHHLVLIVSCTNFILLLKIWRFIVYKFITIYRSNLSLKIWPNLKLHGGPPSVFFWGFHGSQKKSQFPCQGSRVQWSEQKSQALRNWG